MNESYNSSTSMSEGRRPAMRYALSPESLAGVTVRSGIPVMLLWVCDSPQPRIATGLFLKERARSTEVMMTAPPPSLTKQQSLR